MISAVVTTYNEADKLRRCLESVEKFAPEIVVVDLGSTDQTLEVANEFGAKIFKHNLVSYVELIRNFCISKASGDWVLILDPDERATPQLTDKLKEIVKEDKYSAVNIPRKNIFFGRWIAHSNWWPDKHIRFFKKARVRWTDKIHSYPKVEGTVLELANNENVSIEHFGYESINEFISRQYRYSSIEAEYQYQNGIKFSWGRFIWKPLREFLARYVKHLAFLDGFYGFALTYLMMVYQVIVMVKVWELERNEK